MEARTAKYMIGQVVRHRSHPFRGVVFDIDPEFANSEEWYQSIPEDARPEKDQPYYHLYAETEATYYVAYVSEQNLVADQSGEPVEHPELMDLFGEFEDGYYPLQATLN
ncbi:heat shock protein HspQ [Paracoccus aerodenitrificans]|uniref:heat shock protein HspQ n=1 Tax=Paracoccus aerodenitrificans TaxID=3017781 RepID=UPI0022EFEA09|nr:heat shock protein HspQ [Paracoccus aerodenitrificans]WBU63013.1 heat shock protein HspQ [Paracoccus aerodenitrificans]